MFRPPYFRRSVFLFQLLNEMMCLALDDEIRHRHHRQSSRFCPMIKVTNDAMEGYSHRTRHNFKTRGPIEDEGIQGAGSHIT